MLIQSQHVSVWCGGVANKMKLALHTKIQSALSQYEDKNCVKCFRLALRYNRCSVWLQEFNELLGKNSNKQTEKESLLKS